MNALKLLAALALVCQIGTGVRADEKDYPKLIVGSWMVSKADEGTVPQGTVIEFTKDGKVKAVVKKDDAEVNGKSIMEVMMLAASQGSVLEIVCEGPDAEKAAAALKALVDSGFDEE